MDFQSEKSFGKLRLRAFQPYHQVLCILKHVEDVEDNLRHLRHASIYIGFDQITGIDQAHYNKILIFFPTTSLKCLCAARIDE